MGGGRRTPQSSTTVTEANDTTDGASVEIVQEEDRSNRGMTEDGDGPTWEREGNPRFTEPSSESQQQLESFMQTAEGQVESIDGDGNREEQQAQQAGVNGGVGAQLTPGSDGSTATGIGNSDDNVIDNGTGTADTTDTGANTFDIDRVETEAFADSGVEPDASTTEKAREYLSRGALADRHAPFARAADGMDGGQRAIPREESRDGRFGGWEGYSIENTDSISPLDQEVNTLGRTQKHMQHATLDRETADQEGTDNAFVTNYAHDFRSSPPPREKSAQSQMALYGFCDAVGVRVPRHTYDENGEWVAAEGVTGTTVEDLKPGDFPGRRVDPDEFKDLMAVHLLAGNTDLSPDNVKIDEDGHVHCFDLDFAFNEYNSFRQIRMRTNHAKDTSNIISWQSITGPEQDEDMLFDRGEFAERAQEIAVSIHNSGDTDRVVEAAAAYEDLFDGVAESHSEQIRNNIEVCVEHARQQD